MRFLCAPNSRRHSRFFERHLRATGKTSHTITSFISDLKNLAKWSGDRRHLNYFTHLQLIRYLEWMEYGRDVPCSRKTYSRRVTTLKVFFGWLTQIRVMRLDPAEELLQRSGEAPLSKVLNSNQIAACEQEARKRMISDPCLKWESAAGVSISHLASHWHQDRRTQ